ncbi:MAG TPA: 4Fe-4S dicluster domain-containing protein [bacterium]|nr:4Fe-4S dicluster domain-containing protein [bacterium]
MSLATLIDTTRCIGCRACQVACKAAHDLPAEKTGFFAKEGGYQNPPALSAKNLCVVTFNELEANDGEVKWIFAKRQCMHCNEPACVSACPVTALHKTPEGPVTYDSKKCMGCRYCVWACPFGVPTADWDSLAPKIHKCTLCHERITATVTPQELNGKLQTKEEQNSFTESQHLPACVKACPSGALKFGERDQLLAQARERIKASPGKYVSHIYGEKEAGGTAHLYLASVPFEKLGFRMDLGERSYPYYSKIALEAVSPAVMGLGGLLTAVYLLKQRKDKVSASEEQGNKE